MKKIIIDSIFEKREINFLFEQIEMISLCLRKWNENHIRLLHSCPYFPRLIFYHKYFYNLRFIHNLQIPQRKVNKTPIYCYLAIKLKN